MMKRRSFLGGCVAAMFAPLVKLVPKALTKQEQAQAMLDRGGRVDLGGLGKIPLDRPLRVGVERTNIVNGCFDFDKNQHVAVDIQADGCSIINSVFLGCTVPNVELVKLPDGNIRGPVRL